MSAAPSTETTCGAVRSILALRRPVTTISAPASLAFDVDSTGLAERPGSRSPGH